MKHITKQLEPKVFTKWKKIRKGLTYSDLSEASPKSISAKKAIYDALLEEQGHICCYCEGPLRDTNYHIEHPSPRSQFPKLQLEFSNMLCSCQRNSSAVVKKHCGTHKNGWHHKTEFISPLDKDCETRFKYSRSGEIFPSDENDSAAQITIEKLNLQSAKLIQERKNVLFPFNEETLTKSELKILVDNWLVDKSQNNGKFNIFYTTVKALYA